MSVELLSIILMTRQLCNLKINLSIQFICILSFSILVFSLQNIDFDEFRKMKIILNRPEETS